MRPAPSLTVGIRTRLRRPAMLERAVASVRGAPVLLVSAVPPADLADEAERLRRVIPDCRVTTLSFDPGELPVRAAGLAEIVEAVSGDYLWVLDDDDYLEPSALTHLALAVQSSARPIVVGTSRRIHETWQGGRLLAVDEGEPFDARRWFNAFSGWNSLPVCSVVYPRLAVQSGLAATPLAHDLGEDYALFLLALTRPGQDVVVIDRPVANVSIREGGDNVVTDVDRGEWMLHTASFLSDITRNQAAGAPLPWLLGEALAPAAPPRLDPIPVRLVWWKRLFWTAVPDRLHPLVRRLRGR